MLGISLIEFYARLLIVVPLVVVFVFLLVLILLISIKWLRFSARDKAGQREARQERIRPDGLPYPPSGRGMCDNCQRASDKVYYMPSGERLCAECYQKLEMPSEGQATSEGMDDTGKGETQVDSC